MSVQASSASIAGKPCRWGIMGAAAIARKNWQGLRWAENSRLIAVASRSLERSQSFIRECQGSVPQSHEVEALGSYEELLSHPEVDAVYIPLPTGVRKEWILRAIAAGKHVLSEKPVTVSVRDLREIVAAAQKANLQFMDGVMFMHSARLEPMVAQIMDSERVGRVRRICSHFSFHAPESFFKENIRASDELEPLGCLGDLGWYNIRMTLCGLRGQMPHTARARCLQTTGNGVPTEFSAELDFEGGTTASFYCSFHTETQQWAHFSGEKGYVSLDDFVLPWFGTACRWSSHQAQVVAEGCFMRMENHERYHAVDEIATGGSTAQETNMFRTFSNNVLTNSPDSYWPEMALKTQLVLEACLLSARKDQPVPVEAC